MCVKLLTKVLDAIHLSEEQLISVPEQPLAIQAPQLTIRLPSDDEIANEAGICEQGVDNREQGVDNCEQGVDNREQGVNNREQEVDDRITPGESPEDSQKLAAG